MSKPKNSKDALEFIHTLDSIAIKKQKEEIERLKSEVENANRINAELLVLSNRQASEIRMLRKAGDAMAFELEPHLKWNPESDDIRYQVRLWNATKEGKPSV